jgi:glycogen debranching enzyme
LRPNQLLAVGGLPYAVLDSELSRSVVDAVEASLWTPIGLRTLPPDDTRYVPRYEGGVTSRDGSYHQGTVWPWLLGPFVEAWVRVHGGDDAARADARLRFFDPLLDHLSQAGVGHISEIADAEAPHTPRGCPFQAWSVGEALRLDLAVLGPAAPSRPARRKPANAARH